MSAPRMYVCDALNCVSNDGNSHCNREDIGISDEGKCTDFKENQE